MSDMRFSDLQSLGVPEPLIAAWVERMGLTTDATLLDLQGKSLSAINELLRNHSLILGPTSGGKTFVGEVAAALVSLQGQGTVVYAVPYRAIATEKWREWSFAFRTAGFGSGHVYVSSSDHIDFDFQISQGEFRILIIVYEKLAALLAQGTRVLDNCELLIVDEFQMLGQPERGPRLEFVLTRALLDSHSVPRRSPAIMGLSSSISRSGNERLSEWLSSDSQRSLIRIESATRPVRLQEAVVTPEGLVLSKAEDGQLTTNRVNFPEAPVYLRRASDSLVAQLIASRSDSQRNFLIFRSSRSQTAATAHALQGILPKRSVAEATRERVEEMEQTPFIESLQEGFLSRGVAYHNASLSFEERQLVEELFATGELSVLCCTETLAAGVNLPADTVVVAELRRPAGERGLVDISVAEYKNMVGRAGRLGILDPMSGQQITGQSYIFADNEMLAESLYKRYIAPDDPGLELESATTAADLQHQILSVLSAHKTPLFGLEVTDVEDVLKRSFYAHTVEDFSRQLREAWRMLLNGGLIGLNELSGDGYGASSVGSILARTGLMISTARYLNMIESELAEWDADRYPLDLLFLVCLAPEVAKQQWPSVPPDERNWVTVDKAKELVATECSRAGSLLKRILDSSKLPITPGLIALKRMILIWEWSRGKTVREIAARWGKVHGGDLRSIADVAAWVLDGVVILAQEQRRLVGLGQWLREFQFEVEQGLPFNVHRVSKLAVPGLRRPQLLKLSAFLDEKPEMDGIEAALEDENCPLPMRLRTDTLRTLLEVRERRFLDARSSHERRSNEQTTLIPELGTLVRAVYAASEGETLEQAIVELLGAIGLSARWTGELGPARADIEMTVGEQQDLILVEVKGSGRPISYNEVRQVQSALTDGREVKGRVVISKRGFTENAVKLNSLLPTPQQALLLELESLIEGLLVAVEEAPDSYINRIESFLINLRGLQSDRAIARFARLV